MILAWALLLVLTGATFGWIAYGRGPRSMMVGAALLSGALLAAVAVAAGVYTGARPLGSEGSVAGVVASVTLLTLWYGLGTWAGSFAYRRSVVMRALR